MRRLFARPRATGPVVSESERALFGGALRYDLGFTGHDYATLDTTLPSAMRALPRLVACTVRLAWETDRRALLTVGACQLGQGVSQALRLLAVNAALGALLAGGDPEHRLQAALPALVAVALISAVGAVLGSASTAAAGRLEPKIDRLATERYLHAAVHVELEAAEDGEFRRLIDAAQAGAGAARHMLGACVSTVHGLLTMVATAGVLTVLHPLLLPMLVLIAAPRGWGAMRVAQRRYASVMNWLEHVRAGRLIGSMLTSRQAACEVRVHGVGGFLLGHYRVMAETAEDEQTRLAREKALTELLAAALSGLATLVTYAALAALIVAGHVEIAAAGTAVLAIRSGSATLGALVMSLNRLHEEGLYVHDLDRFLREAAVRAIPDGGADLPAVPEEIVFENVSFTYPGRDVPALREVSLTIRTGTVTALVGENGGGKSTLVKLLAGLHLPQSGRILWDGLDLTTADRQQVFARTGILTQDFQRWPFTAGTNIRIGRPERAPEEGDAEGSLESVAAFSGADAVIAQLPRGLDTLLARQMRGGVELSGGQWQKLGLSRSVYRGAPLIVVDEPTSALDPEAEITCFEKIRSLAGPDRAVVLVTHRMAAVQHADVIHVLHGGRLVEQGSHSELLARAGRYASMFRRQASQYGAAPATPPRPGDGSGPSGGGPRSGGEPGGDHGTGDDSGAATVGPP
ncbi:ABC transporter ATP-binding protein [Streptomyces sp. SAJ15]|uniref:ABC transporter ATP-binding protein n=1 Tax=Streptomyces sp. SAJ15 TaxID=2011095 RepID=UPI0011870878|nr:ABC transporter ATP-binding protein [Streptomyces sp. SAJ15]TVL89278.1 ABC transporter [Streptomyces sp. SAJ15]